MSTMNEFFDDLWMTMPIGTYKFTIQQPTIHYTFGIEKVIYHDPATIIKWKDGTKTVVKCDKHDTYDPEKGLYIAIMKKMCGNRGKFYKEAIEPWLPKKEEKE